MNQKTKRRKTMNEEEIKRIIEEYLKGNLRLEAKSRYLDEYSSADNYITVYLGDEIQRSYIPRLINLGFTRKEISEIMNLGVQLVSDYYNKYKETYG